MLSPPSAERQSRLSPQATALYALLWLVLLVHGWAPIVEFDAIWWLQLPAASAERMTSRDLELGEAIAAAEGLERDLLELLYDDPADSRALSIEIWDQLIDSVEREGLPLEDARSLDEAHARLAVLLAEAGELDAARDAAEHVAEPEAFAEALCGAYGCGDVAAESEDVFRDAGLTDWYLDRPRIALARALARVDEADALSAELERRGERWKVRSGGVALVNLAIVVVGSLLALAGAARGRALFEAGPNAPPWTLADGIGVFVRGDFFSRAYFVGLASLDQIPGIGPQLATSAFGELLESWATLLAGLPLLWLVYRHLLAPQRLSALSTFGLKPSGEALRRTLSVAAAAIAIDLAGTYAIGFGAWKLGLESSWTEGFDEMLVWGSTAQAWMTTVDYVAWAPTFEELAFRGVLYYSLRHRLSPAAAASSTAVFFAGMHFYTLPGFLMTLWSGFVWALAFERARSLLPGLFAHAVYNALYVMGLVLLYR